MASGRGTPMRSGFVRQTQAGFTLNPPGGSVLTSNATQQSASLVQVQLAESTTNEETSEVNISFEGDNATVLRGWLSSLEFKRGQTKRAFEVSAIFPLV